jgi:hypothetical protein
LEQIVVYLKTTVVPAVIAVVRRGRGRKVLQKKLIGNLTE